MGTHKYYILIAFIFFILINKSCVLTHNPSIDDEITWVFEPEIEVPNDGNFYIVPQRRENVYTRPTTVSKKLGQILEYPYSPISSPELVQVFSYKKTSGEIWWETEYDGKKGYFYTSKHPYFIPYVANDYPPEMDIKGGYVGDELLLTEVRPSIPNSAGGVDLRLLAINPKNGNTIKYITTNISPFNAVGDLVQNQINGSSERTVRATGPIETDGRERLYRWDNVFYNSTIVCVEINYLIVEYMNGDVFRYYNDSLKTISHKDLTNDCSYEY